MDDGHPRRCSINPVSRSVAKQRRYQVFWLGRSRAGSDSADCLPCLPFALQSHRAGNKHTFANDHAVDRNRSPFQSVWSWQNAVCFFAPQHVHHHFFRWLCSNRFFQKGIYRHRRASKSETLGVFAGSSGSFRSSTIAWSLTYKGPPLIALAIPIMVLVGLRRLLIARWLDRNGRGGGLLAVATGSTCPGDTASEAT